MSLLTNIVVGSAYIKIMSDNSGLEKNLSRTQKKLKEFADKASNLGNALLKLAPIGLAIGHMTKTFQEFDDRMRMVKAVTGATAKQFDLLTAKAKKLGRETRFTASQVADGMISLGRMGFSTKEIDNAIKPVMDLSTATGTELATASEIAANNMRVFGMRASEMNEAADLLSVTANGSAQNLVDLGEALKMAGPHAKNAGADLKETCAALGILANMGIRGSLAGTALGKSYKRLADPAVQDYLVQFGIRTVDAAGNLRRMRDILVEVGEVMRSMPSAQRITFAEKIFDAHGSLGGGILSGNMGNYDEFLKKLDNASGEAARIAKEMEDGIGGSFRSMMSAVEGVEIAVGTALNGPLSGLMNYITGFLRWTSKIIQNNKVLVTTFAAVVGGGLAFGAVTKTLSVLATVVIALLNPTKNLILHIGTAVGACAKAVTGFKSFQVALALQTIATKAATAAQWLLNIAMSANPVGIVIAAIGALVSLFILFENHAQKVTDELHNVADEAQKTANATGAALSFGDKMRIDNKHAIERLQQLEEISKKTRLTAEQIKEAGKLLEQLDPFGTGKVGKVDREFGVVLNKTTKDVETENRSSARRDLLRDYDAKRKAYIAARAVEEDVQNRTGYGKDMFSFGLRRFNLDSEMKEASAKRLKAFRDMALVQKRLRQLDAGNKNAVYGTQKTESPSAPKDLIQLASKEEIDKAEKLLSEANQKLAQGKQDRFDQEIDSIRKANTEYKKQAQFLLENEKKKLKLAQRRQAFTGISEEKTIKDSKARIADYERQIAASDVAANEAISDVRIERNRVNAEADIELEFNRMNQLKQNGTRRDWMNQYPVHLGNLQNLLKPLTDEIKRMSEKYKKQREDALQDGKIDSDEEAKLNALRIEIGKRQEKIESYRNRAKQGYDVMEQYRATVISSTSSAIQKGSTEAAVLENRMQIVNPVRQDIEKVRKAINNLGKTGKDFYHDYLENNKTNPKYIAV